jgi:hypothetical protein
VTSLFLLGNFGERHRQLKAEFWREVEGD